MWRYSRQLWRDKTEQAVVQNELEKQEFKYSTIGWSCGGGGGKYLLCNSMTHVEDCHRGICSDANINPDHPSTFTLLLAVDADVTAESGKHMQIYTYRWRLSP